MAKIVFVLIDGLDVESTKYMAYLAAQKEHGALYGVMNCELPTVSKPIYSTIFTGKSPIITGVTHNKSNFMHADVYAQSFFERMHGINKISSMAAYYWMRELYFNEKFNSAKHRLSLDEGCSIPYAMFYDDDFYPDRYVFQDAEALRTQHNPDFLLVHTMGVDAAGHGFGANSLQYRNAVRNVDILLAEYATKWLDSEMMVIVTSDHGMHADGAHNDTSKDVREVPYWILGNIPESLAAPTKQNHWYDLLCNYFAC